MTRRDVERTPAGSATEGRPPSAPDARDPLFDTLTLVCVISATLLLPLGLRAMVAALPDSGPPPSYLPALETARHRTAAFDAEVVSGLQALQPEFVFIGDSMVGSRIDATHLTVLLNYRTVAPIYHAGTGSAFWYLALKNWVVASQVHPKLVVIFFRDENLTDPMFRVSGMFRANLDRVAREREPVLDEILALHTRGAWFQVHAQIDEVYRHEAARAWLEPRLTTLPAAMVAGREPARVLLERINSDLFGLAQIRPMAPADVAHREDQSAYDFARNLPGSVLPEMFAVARHGGLKLAFVRVQRRPEAGAPPRQSPALRRYVHDLRAYIEANGGLFADDWGDPDQPLSMYADGDHVSREFRERYTELFLRKHPAFFR